MCVWSYLTLCNRMDHQASLFMEFSRQEYWSGLSFPTPGDLPQPGVKPTSFESPALAGRFFTTAPPYQTSDLQISPILWEDFSLSGCILRNTSIFNFDEVQFTFYFASCSFGDNLRIHYLILSHKDLILCFFLRVL